MLGITPVSVSSGATTVGSLRRFDLSALPQHERFDFWRELGGRSYATTASPFWRDRVEVRSWIWSGGPAILTSFEASPFTTIRGEAEIRSESAAVLKIKLYRRGTTWRLHAGRVECLQPGAVHVIDQSRPKREVSISRAHLALIVPHEAVGYDVAEHAPLRSFSFGTSDGYLIAEAMLELERVVLRRPSASHDTEVFGLVDLLSRALTEKRDGLEQVGNAQARRRAIRRYARRALCSGDVSVEMLKETFGVSRASVYRAFAEDGGVESFLMQCRLERAFDMLCCADERRGVVGQTAERMGFGSIGHFTRSFRQHFGVPPSEIVAMAAFTHDERSTAWHRDRGGELSDYNDLKRALTSVYAHFGRR